MLPEAKEKQEYMLMLSESSEESATFFLRNNFNALEQREGFYSIHIQSCLKALCDGRHNQISAQRNSCSHQCINHLEESEKLLWNPARSAQRLPPTPRGLDFPLNMWWKDTGRRILVPLWVPPQHERPPPRRSCKPRAPALDLPFIQPVSPDCRGCLRKPAS